MMSSSPDPEPIVDEMHHQPSVDDGELCTDLFNLFGQSQKQQQHNNHNTNFAEDTDERGDLMDDEEEKEEGQLHPPPTLLWHPPSSNNGGDQSVLLSVTPSPSSTSSSGGAIAIGQQQKLFEQIVKLAGLSEIQPIGGNSGKESAEGQREKAKTPEGMREEEEQDKGQSAKWTTPVSLSSSMNPESCVGITHNSSSSASSSSRRKSFNPTRIKEDHLPETTTNEMDITKKELNEGAEAEEEADDEGVGPTQFKVELSVSEANNISDELQNELNPFMQFPLPPLFPAAGEGRTDEEEEGRDKKEEHGSQHQIVGQFARFLKNELTAKKCDDRQMAMQMMGKVDADLSAASLSSTSSSALNPSDHPQHQQQQQQQVQAVRLWTAALAMTRQQQQLLAPPFPPLPPASTARGLAPLPHPAFPWIPPTLNPSAAAALFTATHQHPLMAATMAAFLANSNAQSQQCRGGNGIFPPLFPPAAHPTHRASSALQNPNTGNEGSSLNRASAQNGGGRVHNYPLRIRPMDNNNDDSPRKKRSKVTDCVRGPRSSLHRELTSNSLPISERSTPVPTMVTPSQISLHNTHARLMAFRSSDRRSVRSPAVGNDGGASSGDELNGPISPHRTSSLTHMHLRKAKLMFFYQRYPSSSLLKSYFPDVFFTKHNTAQLVKWFSNFREFFYMQMEKFAKQALADGLNHADEIFVSTESEVYKQLQQHYNKNSTFQPPERLLFVIRETMREFFNALQQGRAGESSWKKAIYKVIQQLDEPIPEFFRDPQFVELLEQQN